MEPVPGRPVIRPRGRPVSEASRLSALRTAAALLTERGFDGFTVEEVARRSGVGKATIYRHWPGAFALAVEAYGDTVTDAVPVIDTGDLEADLTDQVIRLAAFYASPAGRVATELIAAAITQKHGDALVRGKFFDRRRRETAVLIDRGSRAGLLHGGLDTELVIDLVFGGVVFRLFNGMGPLDDAEARAYAAAAVAAVVRSPRSSGVRPAEPVV